MPPLETLPPGDPSEGVFYLRIVLSPEEASRPWVILNNFFFHGEELLAPRPTPKLEDHPLSAVRDCLFDLFATTLHIGGRSSIRNLRTHHAVVTGTHKHRPKLHSLIFILYGISSFKLIYSLILFCITLNKIFNETCIRDETGYKLAARTDFLLCKPLMNFLQILCQYD